MSHFSHQKRYLEIGVFLLILLITFDTIGAEFGSVMSYDSCVKHYRAIFWGGDGGGLF